MARRRKTGAASVNETVTTEVCLTEKPHALVQYLDKEHKTDKVPVLNIPEVKEDLEYEKGAVLDIFWYPVKDGETPITLPEFRGKNKSIKTFPTDSDGSGGAGFYPGTILNIGSNMKDLQCKIDAERPKELSDKCLKTLKRKLSSAASTASSSHSATSTKSSSSATSSGYSSAQTANKKAHPTKKHKHSRSLNESSHSFDRDNSDDESDSSDSTDDVSVSEKYLEEKLNPLQQKVGKYKRANKKLVDEIASLKAELKEAMVFKDKFLSAFDLNMSYQAHMKNCKGFNTISQEKVEIVTTSPPKTGNILIDETMPEDKPVEKKIATPSGQPVERKIATPSGKPAEIGGSTPQQKAVETLTGPVEETVLIHLQEKAPVEDILEGGALIQNGNGEMETGQQIDQVAKPGENVSIYEGICINKDAYLKLEKFLQDEDLYKCKPGKENDRKFVLDACNLLFTEEELASRTVSGDASNIQKKRLGGDAIVYPKLCPIKVRAVECVLMRRILKESKTMSEEDKKESKILDRASDTLARKWLGELAHNVKKRVKRANNKK